MIRLSHPFHLLWVPRIHRFPLHRTNPFFTMGNSLSQQATPPDLPRSPEVAPASKPSSKGKAKAIVATVPLIRTISDIENQPEVAQEQVDNAATTASAAPLPLYSYKQYRPVPAVVYTQHEEEANDLVQSLKGPIGFDLEWVVIFRRGRAPAERRTALVQLCDANMILLIQVSAMNKFPQKVKELIENKDVMKLGANIRNDGQKLFRDFGILPANLVELGVLARQADPAFSQHFKRSIVALAKVIERYTGKTLNKGKVRTSDWEAKLSDAQKTYAANDAHCALSAYNNLVAMAKEHEREIKWEECSSDLEKVYRAKIAAAAPAPPVVDTASPMAVREEEEESESETPSTAPDAAGGSSTSGPSVPTPLARTSSSASNAAVPPTSFYARTLIYARDLPGLRPSSTSGPSTTASTATTTAGAPPRPQHLRAYNLWHHRDLPLHDICAALRSKENPLAESTVISYVVRALQADPSLPYSMDRLKAFVQLEAGSWQRHRQWILEQDGYNK
ncbi:ribonuclease H-like domain-containing protein [Fomes fomentarius]|nr:ribonuclease H-like domain-containing protein [Fomes fomentarius]